MKRIDRRLCIAPMMTHTDRHFRYLLRLISRRVMLYTEMITTGALIHGKQYQRLEFDINEHPLAIQLGGSDPGNLSLCAAMVEEKGYDEINLNIGCPSDRVRDGEFGACLMAQPERVAECIHAMCGRTKLPVTVKTRIGIDDRDSYEHLRDFIQTVSAAGCRTFIIHARKAWLEGLSPRQNREVPSLNYPLVYRLKADFPELEIIINGGISSLAAAAGHLEKVDGVMIGRAVCHNPYLLSDADRLLFGDETPVLSRHDVLEEFIRYAEMQLRSGVALQQMSRHLLGLFRGQAGARAWRRHLSEKIHSDNSGVRLLIDASGLIRAA